MQKKIIFNSVALRLHLRGMPSRKSESELKGGRALVTIGLTPEANAVMTAWLDRNNGWGKSKFVQTLVERFTRLPESVQQVFMGTAAGDMREDYVRKAGEFFTELAMNPLLLERPIQIASGKTARKAAKEPGK